MIQPQSAVHQKSLVRTSFIIGDEVEGVLCGRRGEDHVPGDSMNNALWFAGRARGVEQEEHVLGFEFFARTVGRGFLGFLLAQSESIAVIGAPQFRCGIDQSTAHASTGLSLPIFSIASSTFFLRGTTLPRRHEPSQVMIIFDFASPTRSAMAWALNPPKITEWGAPMRGTGEHRDRELGHHAHINSHDVALGDALGFEDIGELGDFGLEVFVAQRALVDWFAVIINRLAFPDDCRIVAVTRFDLSVDTVVADICFAAIEPFGVGGVPFEHRVPFLEPVEILSDIAPECLGRIDRFFVHLVVLIQSRRSAICSRRHLKLKVD